MTGDELHAYFAEHVDATIAHLQGEIARLKAERTLALSRGDMLEIIRDCAVYDKTAPGECVDALITYLEER